jgi:hypothetical protein
MFDELFTGLTIRPLTKKLVTHVLLDIALTPAMTVDFGVDSDDHYRALKEILFVDDDQELSDPDEDEEQAIAQATEHLRQRIVALDAALGNGQMLNALVNQYAPQYVGRVHFCTSMDVITGRAKP